MIKKTEILVVPPKDNEQDKIETDPKIEIQEEERHSCIPPKDNEQEKIETDPKIEIQEEEERHSCIPPKDNEQEKIETDPKIKIKEKERNSCSFILMLLLFVWMQTNILCLVLDGMKLPEYDDILMDKGPQWHYAWVYNLVYTATKFFYISVSTDTTSVNYETTCKYHFGWCFECYEHTCGIQALIIVWVAFYICSYFLTLNLMCWSIKYLSAPWNTKFKSIALFSEIMFFINFIPFASRIIYDIYLQTCFKKHRNTQENENIDSTEDVRCFENDEDNEHRNTQENENINSTEDVRCFENDEVNEHRNIQENENINSTEDENTNTKSFSELETV